MLLSPERSALLVVDVQERLVPAVHEADRVIRNAGVLMDSATALGIPILATEHYPRGIGVTVPTLRERLPAGAVVEKIHFAASAEPGFMERLGALDREAIVVCGMEAHVCVLQTALGLRALGRSVCVVADAVSSRAPGNAELAVARMRDHGVEIVSTEMVVFEWLQRGGTPEFKALMALIK